jgi:hypothetical protein
MDKNEELQKWLNDDRYVRVEDMIAMHNLSRDCVLSLIKSRKIKSEKKIFFGPKGRYFFYNKKQFDVVIADVAMKRAEAQKMKINCKYVRPQQLEMLWGISSSAAVQYLKHHNIKPVKELHLGPPLGRHVFYDRAECERARPFINQPEQKEVEKVENVNLLETELDSEELASENGSALNDAELAAIITACKDPVDKIMILSALCFGVKSGELSYLDLRDISGADICLQSPSGVVKMRIPKQYEDARTELLTYYVDNGNNLSGDMPVFLNRSGIRMTRQGLNNRMKSVSESANIGRDVKLADLRATFAQNIYKKTEKNIASVHKYLRLSENTNIMGYLLETRSKEQKTMPVDLMNSLTASYQAKESPTIAEPTEQAPDIIPADTIDLFTMSELESELKNRGVELTAEVRAKINASDMPEMKHIATMLRGNAKTIAIRLSVLNEIAGQLRESEYQNILTDTRTNTEKAIDFVKKVCSINNSGVKELERLGFLTRRAAERMVLPYASWNTIRSRGVFKNNTVRAFFANENKGFLDLIEKNAVLEYVSCQKKEREVTTLPFKDDSDLQENEHTKCNLWHEAIDQTSDKCRARLLAMMMAEDGATVSSKLEQLVDAAWIIGNYKKQFPDLEIACNQPATVLE